MKHTYSQLLQLSTAELADLVVAQGAQLDSIKHHQKRIALPIVENAMMDKPSDMPRKLGYTLTSIAHETKVPVRTLRDWFYYRPSALKALVIGAVKIINDREIKNSKQADLKD